VEKDELEQGFEVLWNSVKHTAGMGGVSDPPTVRGLALLGLAVIRLDRTSSRLALVNLGLTLMILFLGITQVALMWGRK
jgi:hypothetical protein